MRKRLSILLLIIGLAAVTSYSKGIAATDNIKLSTIQTNKLNIKQSAEAEKEELINEGDSYSNSKNTSKPGILLVNRNNRLEEDYVPQSLRVPNVRFISYADSRVKKIDTSAASALETLFDAAREDGVTLLAVSGYRDYFYQEKLYNNKVSAVGQKEADKYVAQPGASEHQTGLAMDVLSDEYSSLDEGFEQTQAYRWIKNNCHKYGFIIRYPKGKENITGYNYECWHLRYVGISEATEISQKNITLEEYLNKVE
ncbi:M15 family metallopeptidase [Clostridium peptidivorans]|uniref:M15 family metallopeptidase n=1 Tax=Clostridium peptidivorans TaxID=100174 RepID=UPI000BE3BA97|nr:M15 family metallopeptidase [Clostridium peptidivorans]